MNSSCLVRSSSRAAKPRPRAVVIARIGTPWLWHAKQVRSATCPSAPFHSSGSALPTAARTSAPGSAARADSVIATTRTQTATARSMAHPRDPAAGPLPVLAGEVVHERRQGLARLGADRIVHRSADAADGAVPRQADHPRLLGRGDELLLQRLGRQP